MIIAIYILYTPDIDLLQQSIFSILPQVNKIIIIDNSYTKTDLSWAHKIENIHITILGENIGIAAAQNIGIEKAKIENAKYVLLSDQDTIYPEGYISRMLPIFSDNTVGAVVPRFVDSNKKSLDGFISIHYFLFKQFFPLAGKHDVFQAIASGKIISMKTLQVVGGMNNDLFIDWVDFEWCWRLRKFGYRIVANTDVTIKHRLGDYSISIGAKEVNLRSPTRHYYITRNAFYLSLHSNALDIPHRINLFFKSFRYVIGYPIFSKPRLKNLKSVCIGMWHGIFGHLGKKPFD